MINIEEIGSVDFFKGNNDVNHDCYDFEFIMLLYYNVVMDAVLHQCKYCHPM